MTSYHSNEYGSGYSSGYGSHSRYGQDAGGRPAYSRGYSSDRSDRGRSRSTYGDSRGGRDSRGGSKRSYDAASYTSDGVSREGAVKWFNSTKGYGFITPDDGSPELFVHHSGIVSDGFRNLVEGDRVTYCMETGSDGRSRACNVVSPSHGKRSRGSDHRSY